MPGRLMAVPAPSRHAEPIHAFAVATIASGVAVSNYRVTTSLESAIAGAVVVWLMIFTMDKARSTRGGPPR